MKKTELIQKIMEHEGIKELDLWLEAWGEGELEMLHDILKDGIVRSHSWLNGAAWVIVNSLGLSVLVATEDPITLEIDGEEVLTSYIIPGYYVPEKRMPFLVWEGDLLEERAWNGPPSPDIQF